jgi:hypothetical protein
MAATKKSPTLAQILREAPPSCGDVDSALTPEEVVSLVQTELDLIEEGQEAAEYHTAADVRRIRKFLAKWGHLLG